jgi:hypothetical protein
MFADDPRRFVLAIAATFAVAACGGSALRASKARDAGTSSPDLESKGDLSADNNSVYHDAAADVGVVSADTYPDTGLGRDGAGPDTALINQDAGLDAGILGRDGAGPDTTIVDKDTGVDGDTVQPDALAKADQGTVADGGGAPTCTGTFGSGGVLSFAATGGDSASMALGDLNADGKADVVTGNSDTSTVSVLLGQGKGRLATKTNYPTGDSPLAVALADVDGDGKLDIVTANSGASTLSVLLGNGDGTFAAKVDSPTGDGPVSVATERSSASAWMNTQPGTAPRRLCWAM